MTYEPIEQNHSPEPAAHPRRSHGLCLTGTLFRGCFFGLMTVVVFFAVVACGTTTAGAPISATPIQTDPAIDSLQDPIQLVKALLDDPEHIASMMDTDFLRLLFRAQGDDPKDVDFAAQLRAVVQAVPKDCQLQFVRDTGYSAIAVPPPMNDQSPEQSALIEAAIDGLREGEEVLVYCRRTTLRERVLLFGLNLFHGRIRGWMTPDTAAAR